MVITHSAAAEHEKRLVAATSVVAAVFLTGLKLLVGLTTGSLGILSEAAHSGLDLVAAVVTLWAVRAAVKPADAEHTYGHGKYENLSALFETALLLVTCIWIMWESIHRLFFTKVHVEATLWSFGVMVFSIVVDVWRSRALGRVARKYGSQALEADALHFSTDVWSSCVVIGGLVCVFLAQRFNLPWLNMADALAALGVAGIVVGVSVRMGRKSVRDLLDAVPSGMYDQVVKAARVPGVLDVKQVRMRRSGVEVFADITLTVRRDTPFERAHEIASEAEAAIHLAIPGTDVVIHVEPSATGDDGIFATVRRLAAQHGLGAHGIRVYQPPGPRSIELHLEVREGILLREAHAQVSDFERELKAALPDLGPVVSHIEPASEAMETVAASPSDESLVQQTLLSLITEQHLNCTPHDLEVRRVGEELAVSFHCHLPPETDIAVAHALSVRIEKELRLRLPHLGRVVIHAEPSGE